MIALPARRMVAVAVVTASLGGCAAGGAPEAPAPMAEVAAPEALVARAPAWTITIAAAGEAAASATVGTDRQRRANPLGADGSVSVTASRDGTERTAACGTDFTESRARARASLRAGADSLGAVYQSAEIAISARGGNWREKGTLTCGRRRTSPAESSARVGFRLTITAEGEPGFTDRLMVRATGQPASRLALKLVDSAGTDVPLVEAGDGHTAMIGAGSYVLTGTLQAAVTAAADGKESELSRRATVQAQGLRAALSAQGGIQTGGLRRGLEVALPAPVLGEGIGGALLGGADAWRPCPDKSSCDGRGEDLLVTGASATALGGGARVAVGLSGKGERVDSLVWVTGLAADSASLRLDRLVPSGSTLDRRTTEALVPVIAARLAEVSIPIEASVRAAATAAEPVRWAGTCVPPGALAFEGVLAPGDPGTIRLAYSADAGTPVTCTAGGR